MPINIEGFADLMVFNRFFFPIPGSINIGMACNLKRAKVTAGNSKEGFIKTKTLSPFFIPRDLKPFA